jgi:hypothetical protein
MDWPGATKMIFKRARKNQRVLLKSFPVAGLGLALAVGALPAFAQESGPRSDVQANFPPPSSPAEVQSGSPAEQPQADQPQMDQQPPAAQPDSRDQAPPSAPQQSDAPPQPQGAPQASSQAPANPGPLPQSLTLPAGTVIRVRVDDWITSDRNVIGDNFSGSLAEPIVVGGWVVARRGQSETGRVTQVKKGGHGSSQLGVDLPGMTLVDGQQVTLQTELYQTSGGTSPGRDAAVVGTTTGVGAVIGAIAGRGVGAAIGAGVGATAGIIGVISTPGRPAVIAPESVLSFRLQQSVTISTANSQFAFKPVSQSDYDSRSSQNRPRMNRPAGPPPPPGYYRGPYGYPGYPYPYGPYPYAVYPAPYFGFGYYGRYGWR